LPSPAGNDTETQEVSVIPGGPSGPGRGSMALS
jgi:hypothetical protein